MASFKAKFPELQELFAKNHRGALWPPPPPAGRGLIRLMQLYLRPLEQRGFKSQQVPTFSGVGISKYFFTDCTAISEEVEQTQHSVFGRARLWR